MHTYGAVFFLEVILVMKVGSTGVAFYLSALSLGN
jgi:hypothetical protein